MKTTFAIISNQYCSSLELYKIIKDKFINKGFIYNEIKPDYVFIVGGDGTLLYAIKAYSHYLNNTTFVIIKSGSIGFYSNFKRKHLSTIN